MIDYINKLYNLYIYMPHIFIKNIKSGQNINFYTDDDSVSVYKINLFLKKCVYLLKGKFYTWITQI